MLSRIKELRKDAHISQQQLADVIQISQQSINKYENHNVQPDLQTLIRIAEYFNVSVDYLIGFSDYPKRFSAHEPPFTEEELQFLSLFNKLNAEEKESILLILKNYCSAKL